MFLLNDFWRTHVQQMLLHPQENADLATFTEEILHGKLQFLCSDQNMEEDYSSNYFARVYTGRTLHH